MLVKILEACVGNTFYYMPSRFTGGSMEELSEIGFACSSLLGILHETIHSTSDNDRGEGYTTHQVDVTVDQVSEGEGSVLSNEPNEVMTQLKEMASFASIVLTILEHVQVLLELNALRRGEEARQNLIIQLETVKLLLRLMVLAHRRGLLLHMGSYVSPISPHHSSSAHSSPVLNSSPSFLNSSSYSSNQHQHQHQHQDRQVHNVYVGKRSGRSFHFTMDDETDQCSDQVEFEGSPCSIQSIEPPYSFSSSSSLSSSSTHGKKVDISESDQAPPIWLQPSVDIDHLETKPTTHSFTSSLTSNERTDQLKESREKW
eukprot:CAMPEP_0114333474 /NCGR_PEP_ID=MMETSP0101-20121206/3781_1 /TAXON_ID=38822 ORGANISM="Pteridomonas danica, Strain PT" /NCGR_SAMPLE_ID=MMETSP0101 /ASSEMBLY_ACC=CAM_ASM_000211 /LENGTH=314 /DNA_ID=CAMNT_0001464509 /DNA_START=33 /DNA_END=974 /DNA_ORIENTATION=+